MEKDKKYTLVLGLMIFFFILFVGVCIAWGLSCFANNKSNSNETDNPAITDNVIKEDQTNNTNTSVIKYPYEVDLQNEEIADIITMLEAKIKFVEPSENYNDTFNDTQIIGAAMFFYMNDNPQRDYTGYISTNYLTPIIKKYFGIENITYGDLKGTNYNYFAEKQAYEEPVWGTTTALFIKKAEYFDKSILRVHIDMVETSNFENGESITKYTYTEDMIESKLIVTIKLNDDGSFIISNYGYSEKNLYNK